MTKRKVRVAVNGYGVIGKRVADAIVRQDDMELVGIADIAHDFRVKVATVRGYPVYAADPTKQDEMTANGVNVQGKLDDLLRLAEVVVDCTPRGTGAKYKPIYEKAGVKAIFQGGESHDLTGFSFTAQANYGEALDRNLVRVVSANTTGIVRVVGALKKWGLLKEARIVLFRGGVNPEDGYTHGGITSFIPERGVPSHQGPDTKLVIPDLPIVTMAGTGPGTLGHVHYAMVGTIWTVTARELRDCLLAAPRIAIVRFDQGLSSAIALTELMEDILRPRADMWEVAFWEDGISTNKDEVFFTYQIDNEAIVIPENIDAIRAVSGLEREAGVSISMTDASLGLTKHFIPGHRA